MDQFVSLRNLKFMLYEVFRIEDLIQYPYFQEHSQEIFDLTLETALKMGQDMLRPALREMDQTPPAFINGEVKVHPTVRTFMKESGEGGWIASLFTFDQGGQQIPQLISTAGQFIFSAANYSASVYPHLTAGAANLILSFGSEELKELYVPRMLSGEWQGTMALTEPQAGSSLSDIQTMALPTDQGFYRIRGQKIFISAGDHDGVDNVVHLMLAKIKGAPAGVKGISLFVVPKKRVEGQDLVFNDLQVAGVYHKLGYRGAPITQLSMGEMDDCRGYLVGEPHQGLPYMFQMMNEARINVGLGAAGIASAAYYASLEYTRERLQGIKISAKDPATPQIPIIEHADIKRMLLFQRAITEGSLAILLQCSRYVDQMKITEGEERNRYHLLLDLLTPVAKTYPSEMGILSISQGLQCLGGYGYCDEFLLELFYRDARIHPIHEGTTGIQGLDLLGRKVLMKGGKAFSLFVEEVQKTIREAETVPTLNPYARMLGEALESLKKITGYLVSLGQEGKTELFLADATLYLELFGIITIAWQWLLQGLSLQKALSTDLSALERQFYQGKFHTMRFFYHYELPKIQGLLQRLKESDGLTISMDKSLFVD
ncbi:MAG: acyl-CoA dehydrogenase [Deltaproteobacteria bacterium]|nr:acyl-CoA dehydrogenase [Deltaproteobacteria bacterium]